MLTHAVIVGFEPTVSAGECPQTYALDRAATGTGTLRLIININITTFYYVIQSTQLYKLTHAINLYKCVD